MGPPPTSTRAGAGGNASAAAQNHSTAGVETWGIRHTESPAVARSQTQEANRRRLEGNRRRLEKN